jgi:hypothetical protein
MATVECHDKELQRLEIEETTQTVFCQLVNLKTIKIISWSGRGGMFDVFISKKTSRV